MQYLPGSCVHAPVPFPCANDWSALAFAMGVKTLLGFTSLAIGRVLGVLGVRSCLAEHLRCCIHPAASSLRPRRRRYLRAGLDLSLANQSLLA